MEADMVGQTTPPPAGHSPQHSTTAVKPEQGDPDTTGLHPAFSHPDADVTLGANGHTLFRVHSYTLKTTSGWFNDMFSLPQNAPQTVGDVIYLDEDAPTLEALLRMICGHPLMKLESFDMVESILYAAEKYDTPGPMSISAFFFL
jgi:hypothetical protein